MTEFVYNNIKNLSISYILFELNYGYHPHISFENNISSYLKFRFAKKLAKELRDLISIC